MHAPWLVPRWPSRRRKFGVDITCSLVCTVMAEPRTKIWDECSMLFSLYQNGQTKDKILREIKPCTLVYTVMAGLRARILERWNMLVDLYHDGQTKNKNFGKIKHAPWLVPRWPNQGLEFWERRKKKAPWSVPQWPNRGLVENHESHLQPPASTTPASSFSLCSYVLYVCM